jgi:hypothetical protein
VLHAIWQCTAGGAGLKERVPSITTTAGQLYAQFLARTSSAAGGPPAAQATPVAGTAAAARALPDTGAVSAAPGTVC